MNYNYHERISRLERIVERMLQAQKRWAEAELELVRLEIEEIASVRKPELE